MKHLLTKGNKVIYRSLLFIVSIGVACLFAEPYMAVRTGLKCGVCHVNISGGGKRTDYGMEYAQYKLKMFDIKPSPNSAVFGGVINDYLSMGANMRVDNVTSLAYMPTEVAKDYQRIRTLDSLWFYPWTSLTGPQRDSVKAISDSLVKRANDSAYVRTTNATFKEEGDVYFQVDLVQDFVMFYVDVELIRSGAREYWSLMRLPMNSYAKVGFMLVPYGFRLLDNYAFVRQKTGYDYNTRAFGAEVGFEPGPVSIIVHLNDQSVTTVGTLVFRRWRVGASYARKDLRTEPYWALGHNYVTGLFAGVNAGRFTFLTEGDFVTAQGIDKFAGYFEADMHIRDGLNLKYTGELFDPNTKLLGNPKGIDWNRHAQDRHTIGIQAFITPFTEVDLFYRVNRWVPDAQAENKDEVILRFHAFF